MERTVRGEIYQHIYAFYLFHEPSSLFCKSLETMVFHVYGNNLCWVRANMSWNTLITLVIFIIPHNCLKIRIRTPMSVNHDFPKIVSSASIQFVHCWDARKESGRFVVKQLSAIAHFILSTNRPLRVLSVYKPIVAKVPHLKKCFTYCIKP